MADRRRIGPKTRIAIEAGAGIFGAITGIELAHHVGDLLGTSMGVATGIGVREGTNGIVGRAGTDDSPPPTSRPQPRRPLRSTETFSLTPAELSYVDYLLEGR